MKTGLSISGIHGKDTAIPSQVYALNQEMALLAMFTVDGKKENANTFNCMK